MNRSPFTKRQLAYLFWKRILDGFVALVAIAILLPFLAIIALLVMLTSKGPILFRQKRVGKNKKLFTILKFRTMKHDAPEIPPSGMTREQQRAMTTKFGAFLRKTSIDELPQIFNILIGQMSFIGPRPAAAVNETEITLQRDAYSPSPNALRPGLSGYAQTHGRNHDISLKAKQDAYYAEHISLILDLKIFVLTIAKLFRFEGT